MKQLFKNIFIGAALLVVVSAYASEEDLVEVSKQYKDRISFSNKGNVDLDNKFGKIHIESWDETKLDYTIDVIVKAKTEEKGKAILERILVEIEKCNTVFEAQTIIKNEKSNQSNNVEFEINYTIKLPRTVNLDIKNEFGDVYISNLDGPLDLDLAYGNLKAGKLNKIAEADLSFGTFNIDQIVFTDNFELSYGTGNFDQLDNVEIESSFSSLEIDKATTLKLKDEYGKVSIDEVNDLDMSAAFSSVDVDRLKNSLTLKAEYLGKANIDGISADFKSITIDANFSKVVLEIDRDANYEADIDLSFSSFKIPDIPAKIQKDDFKKDISYVFNKGGSPVNIKMEYGGVTIEHH